MGTNTILTRESIRRPAAAGVAGAALTAVSGAVVQLVVQPSTTVSDQMWSYPWSSAALVPISILWASFHVLVVIGIIALRSSGVTGSRWGRRGLSLAVAGTGLLFVGELASISVRHARIDDASAVVVGLVFAAGILASAIGLLVAGRATMRAKIWEDWRRYTLLAAGIWTFVLLGVNATKALPTGVAIYGLCLLATFSALLTSPGRETREHASARL